VFNILEIDLEVLHALNVGIKAFLLGVSNKDNTVDTLEDQFT